MLTSLEPNGFSRRRKSNSCAAAGTKCNDRSVERGMRSSAASDGTVTAGSCWRMREGRNNIKDQYIRETTTESW